MEKIKTNYATKIINGNFYGEINIDGKPTTKYLTKEEFKEGKQGYMLAPYVLGEHSKESSKRYDDFMKKYHKQHECCPKCGNKQHTTTLVGYVLNWNKKEEYRDMNRCKCLKCGDKHSTHDRIPSNEKQ